ncbi:MAG: anhydro-N-acetylmuramic acid kinase [Flavobacteriales bacterium]|nr:anhydro-N-acetylmuramic acid kinase [Flavobacteriales bacterium]
MPASKRKRSNAGSTFRVLGVMSGSSLDGVDLALCTFEKTRAGWSFAITEAKTLPYPAQLRTRLLSVMKGSAIDLARLDVELGAFIGRACKAFAGERVDLIASHGHTIFHLPQEGLTTQIGSGAEIAATAGITTVCDFRTKDVALGGQGAPLVPLGEQLLFPDHQVFINLGGICNISLHGARRPGSGDRTQA